jgi:flavin-binding protein dodecin
MSDSVYKIIEVVGSSPESWEKAAQNAIDRVSDSIRDLRIAEVRKMDMHMNGGKIEFYRVKLKISFKYQGHE